MTVRPLKGDFSMSSYNLKGMIQGGGVFQKLTVSPLKGVFIVSSYNPYLKGIIQGTGKYFKCDSASIKRSF